MKTLKPIFAVSLFIVGLSLTSCGSDNKYIAPGASTENPIWNEKPNHLPEYQGPEHLPVEEAVQPLPPATEPA